MELETLYKIRDKLEEDRNDPVTILWEIDGIVYRRIQELEMKEANL